MRPDFPKCTKRNFEYRYLFIKTVHHVISMFLSLSTIQMENFIQLKMAQKIWIGGFLILVIFHLFTPNLFQRQSKGRQFFFAPIDL